MPPIFPERAKTTSQSNSGSASLGNGPKKQLYFPFVPLKNVGHEKGLHEIQVLVSASRPILVSSDWSWRSRNCFHPLPLWWASGSASWLLRIRYHMSTDQAFTSLSPLVFAWVLCQNSLQSSQGTLVNSSWHAQIRGQQYGLPWPGWTPMAWMFCLEQQRWLEKPRWRNEP